MTSYKRVNRDYLNATPEAQRQLVMTVKTLQELKPREKLLFYDEFAIYDRPSLCTRGQKSPLMKNAKGTKAVDAVTGEIYLQLQAKGEDVAKYLADLCQATTAEKVETVIIVWDNNSTHKDKMKNYCQSISIG